jgi:hypothetical protein
MAGTAGRVVVVGMVDMPEMGKKGRHMRLTAVKVVVLAGLGGQLDLVDAAAQRETEEAAGTS